MASSEITIASNALQLLGSDPINSFNEGKHAKMAGRLWPQVRDFLLRKYSGPCVRKRVVLAPEAEAPEFDWDYSFLLPGDWIRTLQVGQRGERLSFEATGRKILCDSSTLNLVYVWANTDPAQWDSALCDAACSEMAARMAYPVTQSASLSELKRTEADRALREAKSLAGQDNEPEEWGDSPFYDARF